MTTYLASGAQFSPDRIYRYSLWRSWGKGPRLMVIGLNPSTADETADDPTVRRCLGYARQWGFDGLEMLNLYAYRATDPRDLMLGGFSVGEHNWASLRAVAAATISTGGAVLAAWGAFAERDRWGWPGEVVLRLRVRAFGVACLGRTLGGSPRHPLYLAKSAHPEPFIGDGGRLVTERRAVTA